MDFEDKLKVPAFMRKDELRRRAKKKILFTALDRKLAAQVKFVKKRVKSQESKLSPLPRVISSRLPFLKTSSISINSSQKLPFKLSVKYLGTIEEYFEKIEVGVLSLQNTLHEGDIIIVGTRKQLVESLQINRQAVKVAYKGDDIGLKMKEKARVGEKVYVVEIE